MGYLLLFDLVAHLKGRVAQRIAEHLLRKDRTFRGSLSLQALGGLPYFENRSLIASLSKVSPFFAELERGSPHRSPPRWTRSWWFASSRMGQTALLGHAERAKPDQQLELSAAQHC
jgi:hypothetical protein